VNDDAFDALLAETTAPMVIVTTAKDGVRAGCLVGFHSQCGMDPPGYALWLSKANRTYRVGALSDTFAVHFPRRADLDLAALFGGETGDEVDKFARCGWTEGPEGVPLLDACPNRFVGRRRALVDTGTDHVCLILDPVAVDHEGLGEQMSLADVTGAGIEPGHQAEERQRPR
jgi:flavin reductase (DIM6/NTAB) family NADH-FMN oxidoreductase RutF